MRLRFPIDDENDRELAARISGWLEPREPMSRGKRWALALFCIVMIVVAGMLVSGCATQPGGNRAVGSWLRRNVSSVNVTGGVTDTKPGGEQFDAHGGVEFNLRDSSKDGARVETQGETLCRREAPTQFPLWRQFGKTNAQTPAQLPALFSSFIPHPSSFFSPEVKQ